VSTTQRAPASLILGLSANLRSLSAGDRCRAAATVLATGIHWIREDLEWSQVEPAPGVFHWTRYDNLVRFAAKQGITVLPLIDATPSWAGPATAQALPSDLAAFTLFVADAASRYGPNGQFWRAQPHVPAHPVRYLELYNEPYLAGQDPGFYAVMVRAAAEAVHAVDPGVGVLAVTDTGAWLAGMYAAVPDLFHYAAGVAVHPYSTRAPAAAPAPDTTRSLELVHETLAAHDDGGVPLWITEIGWSTCPSSPSCVGSERLQAAYLAQTLTLARTAWSTYLRALFVYNLSDGAPRRSNDKEGWFGLLRPGGSPKPAWRVLAAAAGG
jgi:hypothetical protein